MIPIASVIDFSILEEVSVFFKIALKSVASMIQFDMMKIRNAAIFWVSGNINNWKKIYEKM